MPNPELEKLWKRLQHYARQIDQSAQAKHKPGAALANYTRTLKEIDELQEELSHYG